MALFSMATMKPTQRLFNRQVRSEQGEGSNVPTAQVLRDDPTLGKLRKAMVSVISFQFFFCCLEL